jgi:hypothetical protein
VKLQAPSGFGGKILIIEDQLAIKLIDYHALVRMSDFSSLYFPLLAETRQQHVWAREQQRIKY